MIRRALQIDSHWTVTRIEVASSLEMTVHSGDVMTAVFCVMCAWQWGVVGNAAKLQACCIYLLATESYLLGRPLAKGKSDEGE
jgi:hypothetical protein